MDSGASSYRRFLDGDASAFDEIMNELFRSLVFFIDRYVHDVHAAEDLAIDVFSDLVVHRHRYNFKVTLKTYAFCQLREQPFSRNMVPFTSLFIDDLCVDSALRGQRIGEQLFDHVKSEAKRLGCYEVTLNVWAGNTSAEAFYEKMGMKTKERQMEYIL